MVAKQLFASASAASVSGAAGQGQGPSWVTERCTVSESGAYSAEGLSVPWSNNPLKAT